MPDRALVKNAADPQQVQRAARTERDREAAWLAGLRFVLALPEGRFVLAELLKRAGLDRTVFHQSGSQMYFNEGRRNFGLEVKAALVEADAGAYELLEREDRDRQRLSNRTLDAVHHATTEDPSHD